MNTGLLLLLNAQLAGLVGYVIRDIRAARTYRGRALDVFDAQLDADLATYARLAGKRRVVAADSENGQQQGRNTQHAEDFAHPPMVRNGADV